MVRRAVATDFPADPDRWSSRRERVRGAADGVGEELLDAAQPRACCTSCVRPTTHSAAPPVVHLAVHGYHGLRSDPAPGVRPRSTEHSLESRGVRYYDAEAAVTSDFVNGTVYLGFDSDDLSDWGRPLETP